MDAHSVRPTVLGIFGGMPLSSSGRLPVHMLVMKLTVYFNFV